MTEMLARDGRARDQAATRYGRGAANAVDARPHREIDRELAW